MAKTQSYSSELLRGRRHWLVVFAIGLMLGDAYNTPAGIHYVDLNSANATPPYSNWLTAATNIQDAVDAAVAGDEVVVTNGTYSHVDVYKPLSLRSVNGAQSSFIDGGSSISCAYLTNGASLCGFTLTNGYAVAGGGAYGDGGGMLTNCTLGGNEAAFYGGGACGCTLSKCLLIGNAAAAETAVGASGGGAYFCTLNNCTLIDNLAVDEQPGDFTHHAYGGGAYLCTLNNCVLTGNSVRGIVQNGILSVTGGGAYQCTLNNCTLTGNSTIPNTNAGFPRGGAYDCTLNNCISFGNYGGSYGSCEDCFSPGFLSGNNNWFGNPQFVDTNGWINLRLQSNSPCINAGNNALAPAGPDLDGNRRIVGGTVDIGAYEFQSPVSQISYAWLEQYGLPINISTDTADPDGDAVDNYHEWLSGTNPTNALSSPAQLTITASGVPPGGVIVTWSTNAVGFTLQSTTNLLSPADWVTNHPAPVVINGQNVFTNTISGAQWFYRLIH